MPVVQELRKCGSIVDMNVVEWSRNYDIACLLGDRYETAHIALNATRHDVPIAHIHGGEASFGSQDNQYRDAISKLAHIHFVAADPMQRRLLDLGEEPWRIHIVGAPGLDNLREALSGPRVSQPYFVLTYHPATLVENDPAPQAIAEALAHFTDHSVLWTGVNTDPGADMILNVLLAQYAEISNLSLEDYLAIVRNAAAVIGNSSSGIIEAPTLEVPTVNIGSRQDGRLKGPSVFDCPADTDAIIEAIDKALAYTGPFTNPYGGPGASKKIADILSTIDLDGIMVKRWC